MNRGILCLSLIAFGSQSSSAQPGERPGKIPALIVSGANNHDWEFTTPTLRKILEDSGKFAVEVTALPSETLANAEALGNYDVLVVDYNGPRWGEAAERNFLETVRGGAGVAVIHAANNAFPGFEEYEKLVAHCWRQGTGHGRFHKFDVNVLDRTHPVTRNLGDLIQHPDELYHRLVHMHDAKFRLLATARSSVASGGTGEDELMLTVLEFGEGRIFHTPLGHVWRNSPETHASYLDPQFQALLIRGIEWAATGDVEEAPPNQLSHTERLQGFRLLFDGESTHAWRGFQKAEFPAQGWSIDAGAIKVHAGGGGGDIITREKFESFELVLDWKVAANANSGIMFRVTEAASTPWQTGPEYQILDIAPGTDPTTTAGALYGLYAAQGARQKPAGEYNRARIVLSQNRLEHWLNGIKVVDVDLESKDYAERVASSKFAAYEGFGKSPRGHIALQDHGNDVWFRNLKIRKLPPRIDR